MPDVKISEYADAIGISIERLLEQLEEAGLSSKLADDLITDAEKTNLLTYLRRKHGKNDQSDPKKIILRRKSVSEIKVTVSGTSRNKLRSKTINVEFRRHKTYVKRSIIEDEAAAKNATIKEEAAALAAAEASAETEERAVKKSQEILAEQAEKETELLKPIGETEDVVEKELEENNEVNVEASPEPEVIGESSIDVEQEKPQQLDIDTISEKIIEQPIERTLRKVDKHANLHRKELHVASDKSGRRRKKEKRSRNVVKQTLQHAFEKPTAPVVRDVEIPENITIAELAQRMSVKGAEVVSAMINLGSMITINQTIDQKTATVIVEEMGHLPKLLQKNALEEEIIQSARVEGESVTRAPVVTIMGHVDHGKTSLLDYIRRTKVAAGEAGGITQHIGAYRVKTEGGEITFLDTPGHEAFIAMRARGAKVTDIAVIVVAANDGVMPQTEEVVKHAKAGNIPMIIAVNKIDKPDADPDKVKQELSKFGVISEDWGGDVQFVNVSAQTGEGIDNLLESISLQAEVLELQAIAQGPASGSVIESRLDKGRGPVATILVQEGELSKGDVILSGHEFGRVRAMMDENGRDIESVGPSIPVEVLGFSGAPNTGDELNVVPDEKKAREIALFRQGKYREVKLARQRASNLESTLTQMAAEGKRTLNILIRTDVQGSAEALVDALYKLSNDEVNVKIVSSGIGGITRSDVNLALASKAIIFGFNVRADMSARKIIDKEGMDLRYYSVIYDVIDDTKKLLGGLLSPEIREQIIGIAKVRDVFRSPKFGDIAGCIVSSGYVCKSNQIRVLRDNVVIYEGELESLKRFKDDVSEVKSGTECGIGVKNYNDVKVGDQIEVFERIELTRTV